MLEYIGVNKVLDLERLELLEADKLSDFHISDLFEGSELGGVQLPNCIINYMGGNKYEVVLSSGEVFIFDNEVHYSCSSGWYYCIDLECLFQDKRSYYSSAMTLSFLGGLRTRNHCPLGYVECQAHYNGVMMCKCFMLGVGVLILDSHFRVVAVGAISSCNSTDLQISDFIWYSSDFAKMMLLRSSL